MRIEVAVVFTATRFALDDLTEDMTFEDVGALLSLEADAPVERLDIYCDHKLVSEEDNKTKTLASLGFHNNCLVEVFNRNISEQQILPDILRQLNAERNALRSNPYQLSTLSQSNPTFRDAVLATSIIEFARFFFQNQAWRLARDEDERRHRKRLADNPFDIEAQRALEEEIRMTNVEAARQEAIEHMPESFASVVMLYIDVKVNGHPIKAFVDSGAQMTIMSAACAERCGLARLIDRRFQGMAVGVGTQRILGRVHMHAVEIAGTHLPTSFSILEKQPMDMLLGLDMLRRHQCCIDLRDNVLRIGSSGATTPFLAEQDLPLHARQLSVAENEEPPSPGGPAAAAAPTERPGAGAGAGAGATKAVVTEEAVAALQQLGFDRPAAVEALERCGGDRERAAAYLLALG